MLRTNSDTLVWFIRTIIPESENAGNQGDASFDKAVSNGAYITLDLTNGRNDWNNAQQGERASLTYSGYAFLKEESLTHVSDFWQMRILKKGGIYFFVMF